MSHISKADIAMPFVAAFPIRSSMVNDRGALIHLGPCLTSR